MTASHDEDTGLGPHLYLIRARCPNCENLTAFVEDRERPVPLMRDIGLSAEHCPCCGVHLWAENMEWDVHEETYVQRAKDATEAA